MITFVISNCEIMNRSKSDVKYPKNAHLIMTPILSDRVNDQDTGPQLAGPPRTNEPDAGVQPTGINNQDAVLQEAVNNSSSATVTLDFFRDIFQMGLDRAQAAAFLTKVPDADPCEHSTAEIAANSPRYRRRSSTFIDGVHDLPDEKASPMAPAQLYSTMSGRLFHSGRIAIVLVGPPARGKT
jgi:hypothetical protein